MSIEHYAELRSTSTGSKIATLWDYRAFTTYARAGYGPTWLNPATIPAANAVSAAVGAGNTTPAGDGAWWASIEGAELGAGLVPTRISGVAGSGVSDRAVLSTVNRDSAIVARRTASARVITIDADLWGIDAASVIRMRHELGRLLDPWGNQSDLASGDLELWWPELCEQGDSCLTKPGNCTGVHWKHLEQIALVDGADLDRTIEQGQNEGELATIRLRLVAADPRIYTDPPANIVVGLDGNPSDTPAADDTCSTISANINLPKTALPIRLNPDRTFCEIGWDIATRDVSKTYIEVGQLEPVYTPPTSPNALTRVEPYGVRVLWNEYAEADVAGSGKTWEKINPARWPADGSFPTDAPIEVQQLRIWEPGYIDNEDQFGGNTRNPPAPYQIHLFWEPNGFDSDRERFVWEPINDQRWPAASGGIRPFPSDAPIEVGLVTYPNEEYDSGEPEDPVDNPKWITERAPRGPEPYRVRLIARPDTQLYGIARALDWTLPNWGATGTESTTDTTHVVVSGDTASSIAAQYGITTTALGNANPWISNINLIYPGQRITIPDQTVQEDTSTRAIEFPPTLARFVILGTANQYDGGGFNFEQPVRWLTPDDPAQTEFDYSTGSYENVSNRASEAFDIVLTQNGMWAEANGSWDASTTGVPPDGGRIRILPDYETDVVETDPSAVDPYSCPPLDPELDITIDTGDRSWTPSGWAFDGEWPSDSILVIPAETPGTYVESVDVHDPNCVACGPDPSCDLEAIFGDSVYVADPPLALVDVASGVTIGTPPATIERATETVGPTNDEDPFDLVITIDPGSSALANWRLLMWENHAGDPIGSLERCEAYRFRFASLPAGAQLIIDTQDQSVTLDCGDAVVYDGSALVTDENGDRPIWPDYMTGQWLIAFETDPANTHSAAQATIRQRIAEPII